MRLGDWICRNGKRGEDLPSTAVFTVRSDLWIIMEFLLDFGVEIKQQVKEERLGKEDLCDLLETGSGRLLQLFCCNTRDETRD